MPFRVLLARGLVKVEIKLFIDEETTSIKDISDFEKQMRKDAKKIHCPIFSLNHICWWMMILWR